ncbi:hypothetical protein GL218_09550 [Daldinia childiae]|uniref:uncharacterized protein n=1 Tax=Daldinia childiae TaxID=326645 RepID=UPI001444C55F|nr:uncharacterized protein GL218_09557 [Daldinia childiae]XP_033435989.1 uncharacterized protein GL218_09550 [Daldinia childiae]KAF3060325.1 hypothetical protein GL218_09557 [Daldinia childiae]KAF3060328.1 hypothetical protein GL218_09550 [Daldinia childiae]
MSSEDSDFYGDDEVLADLKAKVKVFDVEAWWEQNRTLDTPLKMQAQKKETVDISHLHNPYAGLKNAWQLTETIEDNQMIPGGEDEAPEEVGADLPSMVEGGMARLHLASEFIDACKKSGNQPGAITRECRKAGMDAAKDILNLARMLRVRCGKWMLFCSVFQVNEIWETVAKATANNELGIGAKVAPRSTTDKRTDRLICVYTADFSDTKDVKRVVEKLKQLGLIQARDRSIYYKPGKFII